ncbi:MAG: hypothetical protein QXW73_09000, partial [Nitrososphaerales archaeon]
PQIVQIVIDDPNARNPDTNTGGLIVKGQQMQRVHLSDGRWYAFIAERDSFLLLLDMITDGVRDNRIAVSNPDDADNRNTIGSITVTFGNADSFVREITEVGNNMFIEVDKNDIFPTLPEPFTGPTAINSDLDINPSAEPEIDWLYIRLFGIQETNILDVRLDNTSVSLTYNRFYNDIRVSLDRTSYPVDSQIIMGFKDFMWNINPVEEDVVRFVINKNTGRPDRIIYQPLRNFDPANNGVNLFDVLPTFSLLKFDSRQMFEVNGIGNLKYTQVFNSSTNTIAEFPDPGILIDVMTPNQSPVITFIERDPNTSIFESIDETKGSRSNVFAGKRDASTSIDYFDIIATASMITQDAFITLDKEIYDSGDRAIFTIADQDLNRRSTVSERHDGIQSKAFIMVGRPFPLTNNGSFDTLPKDSAGNFLANSIRAVKFSTGAGGTAEQVDFDGGGADFSANSGDIDNRSPVKTDFLASDFSTTNIGASQPTAFIINSNVKLSDLSATATFTMTKRELLGNADPFIRTVSNLKPQVSSTFVSAANDEKITITFPQYNLVYINLSKLNAIFAKAFVEVEASNGLQVITQMVDFEPFDDEDINGDSIFDRDPLQSTSGFGSFRVLDFINVDWNGDSIVGDAADIAQLNNIRLKFTVIITDSANTPLPITPANHQVVLDVGGLGVIRAEDGTSASIRVDTTEHLVYRPEIKEESENSGNFIGRTDFMTVLHNDRVQNILREINVIGDPLRIWLPNRFIPPNRLAVSYTDVDVSGNFRQVSATFIYETRDGVVMWDRNQYRFSQVAFLTLKDPDLNRKPDAIEQYAIPEGGFLFLEFDKQKASIECKNLAPVPAECISKFIEATLKETAPNSGEFRAQITMPERVLLENGNVIRTFKSDIRAVYVDARDSSSNVNQFHATALIRSDIDPSQPQQEPITKNPAVIERGSVKIELDKSDYHPYSRVYITVTAKDRNIDVFRSDIIFIAISRQSEGKGLLNYKLTETGVNTGVFAGYVDLRGADGRDGGIGPRDGVMRMNSSDTLQISFNQVTLSVPIQYNEARLLWNKNRYVIGESAKLQAIEPDMNKNADVTEILRVTLLIKNAKISYELRETELNSGIFAAEIPFVSITGTIVGKEVGVSYGDTVTALYEDTTVPESQKGAANSRGVISITASVRISDTVELVGVNRVVQTDYKLVDQRGNTVTNLKLHDSYRIESVVRNNTAEPLQFEFIVQIKDENGIVELLQSVSANVGPNDSIVPSLDWKPQKKTRYSVETYVWQDLNAPFPLSIVTKSNVIVV